MEYCGNDIGILRDDSIRRHLSLLWSFRPRHHLNRAWSWNHPRKRLRQTDSLTYLREFTVQGVGEGLELLRSPC